MSLELVDTKKVEEPKPTPALPDITNLPDDEIINTIHGLNLRDGDDTGRILESICKEFVARFFLNAKADILDKGTLSQKTIKLGRAATMNLTQSHKVMMENMIKTLSVKVEDNGTGMLDGMFAKKAE